MKRLTEEMVIARTKISDLSSIKRLNCWGSELTDVSLLRRMTNVEVLSLSINKINSLVDFQDCRNLQELYIRQNSIKDLNEVCYLQHLANLKNLWLGENPCASGEGYRLAVLRALPNLQKLDDVSVQPEEVADAKRRGRILIHPDDVDEQESNRVGQEQYWKSTNGGSHSQRSSPEISPTRVESSRQPSFDPEDDQDYYEQDESNERKTRYSPSGQESPPRRGESDSRRNYSPDPDTGPVYYEDRRNANYDGEPARQTRQYDTRHYDRSPASSTNNTDDLGPPPESPTETRVPRSVSNQSVKEYTNGDRYLPQSYQQSSNYRQNDAGSDGSNHSHSGYEQPHSRQRNDLRERGDRCERASCPANHRPPFHRRPVTRNSNILSAVLCLVKELDYPSLEVVEMAVRCRMDELED